jgi:DNA-binding CsgD family transcriptional regulator
MPRRRAGQSGDRRSASGTSGYGLTSAQNTIARRLTDGQSLKQIAHELGRHRRTVADHVRELKRKTGSRTLPELVFRLSAPRAQGGNRASEDQARRICEFARRHALSATQAVVLGLLLRGGTVAGVARSLGRDRGTVKLHIDAVRRKAGACTCVEIAALVGRQSNHAH